MRKKTTKTIFLHTVDDWDLIVSIAGLHYKPMLSEAIYNRLNEVIWNHQDGYGAAGFTPVQGWDWSGIRDSSPQAIKNMAVAARHVLRELNIQEYVVEISHI